RADRALILSTVVRRDGGPALRAVHEAIDCDLSEPTDHFPGLCTTAEGHRAQAQLGHEAAYATQKTRDRANPGSHRQTIQNPRVCRRKFDPTIRRYTNGLT